jgi:hypothetical protein
MSDIKVTLRKTLKLGHELHKHIDDDGRSKLIELNNQLDELQSLINENIDKTKLNNIDLEIDYRNSKEFNEKNPLDLEEHGSNELIKRRDDYKKKNKCPACHISIKSPSRKFCCSKHRSSFYNYVRSERGNSFNKK